MGAETFTGMPGTASSIDNAGSLPAKPVQGVICAQGRFARGKIGQTYLIGSESDYRDKLGADVAGFTDGVLFLRSINKGATLRLTPIRHLSDVTDATSAVGTKASGILLGSTNVAETKAFTTLNAITAAGNQNDTLVIDVVNASNALVFNLGTATVPATPTVNGVAALVRTAIAAHGYTALGANAQFGATAPTGSGTTPNGYKLRVTITGATTVTSLTVNFSGGVAAIDFEAHFTAEEVGDGYNGTSITIANSVSGTAGKVDITVMMAGAINAVKIKNFNKVLTDADKVSLVGLLGEVSLDMSSLTANTLPIGSISLTAGAIDWTTLVDADFIGDTAGGTGFHAFDNVTDSMRIYGIPSTTFAVNEALAEYCSNRGDMVGRAYTPLGLTSDGLSAYIDNTGSPINNNYLTLFYTDIEVNDPSNGNNHAFELSAMGDMMANRSKADQKVGPWVSDSGSDFGQLLGINKVDINFYGPGKAAVADALYNAGLNFVINHPTIGNCQWGNVTTLKDKTSLLSKTNIMDLCVYAARRIKYVADRSNFRGNTVAMFNKLYRDCRPFIVNELVKGGAIEGAGTKNDGENAWWYWFGDQWAASLNNLQYNNKSDVDNGGYQLRFVFKPIGSNEYIRISIAPTDSVTIQNISVLLSV